MRRAATVAAWLGLSLALSPVALAQQAGFDHIEPENVTRVASARGLYNFDALKDQKY